MLTGVSEVVADGNGAGELDVDGGVLVGDCIGEANGLVLGDAVIAGEISGVSGDL